MSVSYQRQLKVKYTADVLVAGGGPAGMAAAVTAAQLGASVLLVEADACFGGMGTAGLVPCFMTFGDGHHFLAGRFGRTLLDRLEAEGGAWPEKVPDNNRCQVAIRAEVLKRVYDHLLVESGAVGLLQTQVADVLCADGHVDAVVCTAKSGLFAARAAVYVDATGDGDLAAAAGAPFEKGDAAGRMMPPTLCSLWSNIAWDRVRAANQGRAENHLPDAIRDGVFKVPDYHLPGIWQIGRSLGGGNVGHAFGVDGTEERSLTDALIRSRALFQEYEQFYKRYLTGYEDMELVATGARLGVRETRRIMGDYVLGLKDFQERAVFEDEVGRYCYPVDIHASTPDAAAFQQFRNTITTHCLEPGESYGIPYRILTPQGLANVLVCGRCVSTDRPLQASIRTMPGCYITGQAAGVAAALAAADRQDVRGVPFAAIRSRLVELGLCARSSKRSEGAL